MIGLFRFVSFPHARQHRLRTSLTLIGIILGVAVIIAISIVNRTLVSSFQRTIDLVAGKSVLQVHNAESGLKDKCPSNGKPLVLSPRKLLREMTLAPGETHPL